MRCIAFIVFIGAFQLLRRNIISLRTIKKHISALSAAEPTQETAIVPVPTTEPVALLSDSLDVSSVAAAAADELSAAEEDVSAAEESAGAALESVLSAGFSVEFAAAVPLKM